MSTTNVFLERIHEICQSVAQTTSLEELYEHLIHFVSKACDAPTSAFMTVAEYGTLSHSFRVGQGTGRFANAAGETLRDEPAIKVLSNAINQRSNHHDKNAIAFYFPHPENFAVLIYVELQQKISDENRKLLTFLNDSVTSSIQAHTSAKLAERSNRATVIALASLAEHKDHDTGEHIMRVAIMTDEIVQVLGELGYYKELITPEFERLISTASILHDVGKVTIPESILQKPAKLDPEERKIIESHTVKGQRVLEKASRMLDGNNYLLKLSSEIALYHHEHYNGQGYPTRIEGQQIPLAARIVGLTDVFDALASVRPYKKAWPEDETIGYIKNQSGRQFDPLIVEAFLKVMDYRREAELIQWTEEMSVKVPHLDNDHRFLIALINQLASAEKIGNRRIAESVLDELINYTLDHFQREEQFLQEMDFPDFAKHKRLHTSFAETIQDVRWQYLHGFRPKINNEILIFLRNWLSKHILIEDMKYTSPVSA
ncbi:MAG TPA: bacteriohemerythrin [Sulfuricella sp.]|nr:bacteriohemerythrin [Sulfuricella sp.]